MLQVGPLQWKRIRAASAFAGGGNITGFANFQPSMGAHYGI
jgi:hypothetical protein